MHVKSIQMRGFMSHADTLLQLPDGGIVVVTGDNGAGKSSFLEAVAYAGWGKTLRGAEPWRDGEAGSLHVVTDQMLASRSSSKAGLKKLVWAASGQEPANYDTQVKAQAALAGTIGEFEVWRRTHVFSSQDAAHFTLATDGERKWLLERLLGLDRFDVAAERALASRRMAEAVLAQVQQKLAGLEARLEGLQSVVVSIRDTPPEPAPQQVAVELASADVLAEVAALNLLSDKARRELLTLQGQRGVSGKFRQEQEQAKSAAQQAQAAANNALEQAQRVTQKLLDMQASGKECPTCQQPISQERVHAGRAAGINMEEQQRALLQVTIVKLAEIERKIGVADGDLADIDGEIEALMSGFDSLKAKSLQLCAQVSGIQRIEAQAAGQASALVAWQARQQALAGKLAAAEKDVGDTQYAVGVARVALAAAQLFVAELEHVSRVFGLKGVRAHVLGRALEGIEMVANNWLSRIAAPGVTLKLMPYAEKKAGGQTDAISLEIVGFGGGRGYKAASGGERRRIDAAILLALAEVSAAAFGKEPGTVFMDEVFDAVDPDGCSAVAEALADLAIDRCVVVITHSPDLARLIPAVRRVTVSSGKVL